MAFSMSGGQYSYNRFTEYERLIEEKVKQADKYGEKKMEKGLDKGSKPDYIDIDGDGNKEESMKKAAKEAKNEHMNYYADVLSRLAGTYHPLDEKKDTEPTDERKEAADRADEEKRQKKEGKKGEAHETEELEKIEDKELSKEAFMAGYQAAMSEAAGAGSPGKMAASVKKEAEENAEETKSMAFIDKKQRRAQAKNAAEEYVMGKLMEDGLANNEVSAETIMLHMSDEWYDSIIAEMGPAYPSETKAQAKAQGDHREGKSSAGLKTGKNPGLKASHTSGANKQD